MIEQGAVLGGRYHIGELLARGGMADVFRARDATLDRDVAVKAFRLGSADVRRFETEARLLARFDHRNLIRVFDAGAEDDQPYVILELIRGPTLARRLAQGPLAEAESRRLGVEVGSALAYVHRAGVVHRDVKPSNILLTPDGRAVLGDFGIAILVDATRLTGLAETVGTAAYLAPEQLSGREISGAADVYSLGLVLLEALTGRAAFTGTPQEIMTARLARPPDVPATLPTPWTELLIAMTRPDPASRPSADAVAARLGAGAEAPSGLGVATQVLAPELTPTEIAHRTEVVERPIVPGTVNRRPRQVRWLAALAAVAMIVVLAAVAASTRDSGSPVSPSTGTTATVPPPSAASSGPSSTTVVVPPTSPSSQTDKAAACAQFESAKQATEREKQRVEQQYRDDKATRERLKDQLEEQKKQIEAQKQAAGC